MRLLLAFIIAVLVIGVLDAFWLGWAMSSFYRQQFGMLGCRTMLNMGNKWFAIILTYFLMVLGFAVFVFPHLNAATLGMNMVMGAVFGAVLFGVYELTSYIVFADWPLVLVWIDMLWGIVMYATISLVVTLFLRWY